MIKKFQAAKKKYPKLNLIVGDPWYASVDRINNNKCYSKRNIQILPHFVNCAKMSMTNQQLEIAMIEYLESKGYFLD